MENATDRSRIPTQSSAQILVESRSEPSGIPPPVQAQVSEPQAPRMARWIIGAVLCGYVINTLLNAGLSGPPLVGFMACLAAVLFLQFLHSTREPLTWPDRIRVLTLMSQCVVTFLPFLWAGPEAGSVAGFLAGSVLLAVSGRIRWALYVLVAAAVGVALDLQRLHAVDVLYGTYFALLTGLMVYGVSSLASLVGLVYAARGELAQVAVSQERLRVARDLHDLLGFNFSAITLRSELAYRLLPRSAARAREELRNILQITRRALADVRLVTAGYQPMSLAAEADSAESMLSAAEIDMDVRIDTGELPSWLDTVLAIASREAATNVLRHSKARRCVVAAVRDGDRIRLRVDNDGVESVAQPSAQQGSGLVNLSERLAAVGGRLVTSVEDDWFRLTAEVPLVPGRPVGPGSASAASEARAGRGAEGVGQPWHLRVARLIAVVVLVGYAVLMVVNIFAMSISALGVVAFAACVAVQAGVHIAGSLHEGPRWPAGVRVGALVLQLAATVLPLLWVPMPWGSMGGFLAGSLLLALPGRERWSLFAVVGLGVLILSVASHDPPGWTAYVVISTLLTGLVVYGVGSLSRLVAQVNRTRDELARMAVTRERLRVARDLHDVLGRDLSRMAMRTRVAHTCLPGDPERARAHVAEVLEIARRAVANVRTVASGYRKMSLAAELDSAVATLGAAGVEVRVEPSSDPIPGDLDWVLATALREAVINVLRHSDASVCHVRVEVTEGWVRLQVVNDGVEPAHGAPLSDESSLGDLATRVGEVGGRLLAEAVPERRTFHLTVELPVSTADELLARSGMGREAPC